MFPRCIVFFLALGVSLATPTQSHSAQEDKTPIPTLKTRARLVLVDVVVTDSKGEPVSGLKKEDFDVSEDGKTQTVSGFEEHKGAPPKQIKLPPMPPEVYTNFPVVQAADSVNILLLDALNTPSNDQAFVHSQMLKYVRGIPPLYNTNGLSDALTRVVNNGSRYYSLTYSPINAVMDGKFRRIQVKMVNGKYSLAYRRGYFADDLGTAQAAAPKQSSEPLLQLMGRNLPDYSQVLFKILVKPTSPQPAPDAPHIGSNIEMKGPFTRYGIDFAVAVDDLKLDTGADAVRLGAIEVMLVAYDPEGKPLNLVVGRSEIRIPAKDYASVQRSGLQIHKEIDIPHGNAFLRTGIYDLKSNNAGTLAVPLNASIPAK